MKKLLLSGTLGLVSFLTCNSDKVYVGEIRSALAPGTLRHYALENEYVINGGFLFNYAQRGYFVIDTDDTCTPAQLSNDYLPVGSHVAFRARALEKNVLELESCPVDVSSRSF